MTQEIDLEAWARKEHYAFFAPMSHPFYSLTFPVDVTALRRRCKQEGLSFYSAMVFGVTKAMEGVEAFDAHFGAVASGNTLWQVVGMAVTIAIMAFGIGKGMMMVLQLISASFGYSVELVIGQTG